MSNWTRSLQSLVATFLWGQHCFVGAGAMIVDHWTVADCAFIKAGSVYK